MGTVAIIPAGGAGSRMEADKAKQYLFLGDRPILIHTLKAFQDMPLIGEVILVVPSADIPFVQKMVWEEYGLAKVKKVLPGGEKRQNSVANGVAAVAEECDIVLIHDAVRCFVSEEIAASAIEGAAQFKAVTMGVPVLDTVKKVSAEGRVQQTISRDSLWLTQTPQAFQRAVIKSAHEAAARDNFYGTDDAELVERIGVPVMMLHGSYANMKITTKEDLAVARVLMERRNSLFKPFHHQKEG